MSVSDSAAKPPGQPGYSAFISYATEADRETAFRIVEHLEAFGLKCWIAPRNVRAGKQYAGEIVRGIGTSRCFLLLLSQASNSSKFVRREVEQADRKDKPIYAVRIQEVDPSDDLQLFLSEIHWIDAWKGGLAAHIKPLGELLRKEERLAEGPSETKGEARTAKPEQPGVSPVAKPAPKSRKQAAPRHTTSLAAKWWLFAVRGALALAVGGALISDGQYPVMASSLVITASLLATYLMADGLLALATGIKWGNAPWRFAFIAEGLLAIIGAASLLSAGYEPTRVALFFVAIAAARVLAALSLDARDGRWSLLTSAACLFGFAFVFVAAFMGADHMVWGSNYLTTWGLLLFAVGAAFLFVAFHLGVRRRELLTADGLMQMRGATAALARIAPAFFAAGTVLIAAGLPFLLWWLLPASPAWAVFGTPFAAMAAIAVGILLYGALALVSGPRMDRPRGSDCRSSCTVQQAPRSAPPLSPTCLANWKRPSPRPTSFHHGLARPLLWVMGTLGACHWRAAAGLGLGDRRRQVPPRGGGRRSVGGRFLPGPGCLGFHRARKHVPVLDGNGHDHRRRDPYPVRIDVTDL